MTEPPVNGTERDIDGERRVYYDGYWIKAYQPPVDSLETKRRLIEALTRRLFNHVEHGINIPGLRLNEARAAYLAETDPARKRVNGAMLAGALINRAADIFHCLVDLQSAGVVIEPENSLMRECGHHLEEALELGRMVLHRSGDEGLDELWGEPFKAFTMPIEDFYISRYVKIAMTLRDVDKIAAVMKDTFAPGGPIAGLDAHIDALAIAAKRKCEVLRTDPAVFDVWPAYVVARERLCAIEPRLPPAPSPTHIQQALEGRRLICDGCELMTSMVRARVPMPKSLRTYIERCQDYRHTWSRPPLTASG